MSSFITKNTKFSKKLPNTIDYTFLKFLSSNKQIRINELNHLFLFVISNKQQGNDTLLLNYCFSIIQFS